MGNYHALVTGAGDGIGSGIARVLARNGYDLLIHSATNITRAQLLCDNIRNEFGVEAFSVQADLSEPDGYKAIFSEYDRHYDRIDLFVNNAGISEGDPFLNTSAEQIDRIYAVNFRSAFLCCQSAACRMVEKGVSGSIITISSVQHEYIEPNMSVYGSLKSALVRLTKQVSIELAQYGIRVNSIAPGWTDSSDRMKPYWDNSISAIPLRRWATVEQIGEAVRYLASPAADYITGTCLVIDGGMMNLHHPLDVFTRQ